MQIMQFLFYQDMEIVSTGNDLFDVLLSLFILGSSTFAKSWCGCHFSQTRNWVQNPSLGGSVGCTSKLHIPVHIFLAGGGEGRGVDMTFVSPRSPLVWLLTIGYTLNVFFVVWHMFSSHHLVFVIFLLSFTYTLMIVDLQNQQLMTHILKCDFEAIKQFLDSMEADPGKSA